MTSFVILDIHKARAEVPNYFIFLNRMKNNDTELS